MDVDALLNVIHTANKFVCIAVMDYYSALIYSKPQMYGYNNMFSKCTHITLRFWPVIDDALKGAMYNRGIKVRVMGSIWEHTGPDMIKFLKSLQSVNGTGENNGTLEVVRYSVLLLRKMLPTNDCRGYFKCHPLSQWSLTLV